MSAGKIVGKVFGRSRQATSSRKSAFKVCRQGLQAKSSAKAFGQSLQDIVTGQHYGQGFWAKSPCKDEEKDRQAHWASLQKAKFNHNSFYHKPGLETRQGKEDRLEMLLLFQMQNK